MYAFLAPSLWIKGWPCDYYHYYYFYYCVILLDSVCLIKENLVRAGFQLALRRGGGEVCTLPNTTVLKSRKLLTWRTPEMVLFRADRPVLNQRSPAVADRDNVDHSHWYTWWTGVSALISLNNGLSFNNNNIYGGLSF